jgi:release factor glutamine methyltransferase
MSEETKTWTIASILTTTTDFFTKKGISSPRLDAELLLSKVLKLERLSLYINFERIMNVEELDEYRELIRRRSKYEPVALILGEKEFYGLPFKIDSSTLVPRPETEHLVDEAINFSKKWNKTDITIADIGTGSGAIALSLAKYLPSSQIIASDISQDALKVAQINAEHLEITNTLFVNSDLLDPPFPTFHTFDIICANLPYIPSKDIDNLPADILKYEPLSALDGGPEGLDFYKKLIPQAKTRLKPGGALIFELHPPQFTEMEQMAKDHGFLPQAPVLDLAKFERIFIALMPGEMSS